MKTILLFFAVFALINASPLQAESPYSNRLSTGSIVCGKKENLRQILRALADKDIAAYNYMLNNKQCLISNGTYAMTVLDASAFGGWAKIRVYVLDKGHVVWTFFQNVRKRNDK